MAAPSPQLEAMSVTAPRAFLRKGTVADSYKALRAETLAATGIDFLAVCGDMFRDKSVGKISAGSVARSLHKCGVAFDYNQEQRGLVLVPETIGGRQYWRTYLRCAQQDGTQGQKLAVTSTNAGKVNAYLFDFTAAAERHGWKRIPAQAGWQKIWSKREFWHYQNGAHGTDYDRLMRELYG